MELIKSIFALFLLIAATQSYAEKLLDPPAEQPPQCEQGYENAGQPKTAKNVFSSLSQVCHYAGGLQLMHKILGNSNNPTGLLLTCTGNNPNSQIFSCLFSINFEEL